MAKQAKHGVELDRLSNLPDEIVCRIISFLPFKQAVCTSILSKRWRYVYASMSTFDFDVDDAIVKHPARVRLSKAKHFARFGNRLMCSPHTTQTLECFRIINSRDEEYADALPFHGWIRAALRLGVKELDLQLHSDRYRDGDREFPMLPTSLYTSNSLVTLKLNMSYNELNVPTNVCFPNLKTLHLRCIEIPQNDKNFVPRLLGNCPVLEDSVIEECDDCDMNGTGIRIHIVKSLVTLKLVTLNFNWPGNCLYLCFPNLKTLHLKKCIIFSDQDSVRRLFSSCIVLEDLVIERCSMQITELHISNPSLKRLKLCKPRRPSVVINAPSLVYFNYVDYIANGYSIENIPSLVQADISLYSWEFSHKNECAANQLLQAIGDVKLLRLTLHQLSNEIINECCREPKLVFRNLVKLAIAEGDNIYSNQVTWLVAFLRCTPNVTSLLISLESKGVRVPSPPDAVPDCLSKLKQIKMLKFDGHSRLFNVITYFLMNASNLEKLTLCMDGLKEGERLSIAKEVMKIPRRSSDKCQVLFE